MTGRHGSPAKTDSAGTRRTQLGSPLRQRDLVAASLLRMPEVRIRWDERTRTAYTARAA